MKAIILLAGYATRLYPLTLSTPKALLEIGGKPILDYIFDEIETIDAIDEVFMVTNEKFYPNFLNWAKTRNSHKAIKIINDGTTSDENRLGAIGDARLVIHEERIAEDTMVLVGDNFCTYKLLNFYKFFHSVKKDCICACTLEDINELRRVAVAQLDANHKVIDMEEKPREPRSNLGVFGTYIYRKDTLPLFEEYIREGNIPDAPGYFPSWLYKKKDVYAFVFEGECYDIGTPESYREVQRKFGGEGL